MNEVLGTQSPYARAREESLLPSALVEELLGSSPQELKRVGSALKRCANRIRWRRLLALRNSTIAMVLTELKCRLTTRYQGRMKYGGFWYVYGLDMWGQCVSIARVGATNPRHWTDMYKPVCTIVQRPDLLDYEALANWHEEVEERFFASRIRKARGTRHAKDIR